MKIKVFTPNHNGKIEFTHTELEKLLNEVYTDGYKDGEDNARSSSLTWTNPNLGTTPNWGDIMYCSDTTSAASGDRKTYTCNSVNVNVDDIKKISEAINSLSKPNDVFTNLAKELGL